MKPLRILSVILGALIVISCQEDELEFSTDSNYYLSFSTDTVKFDTILTGERSASKTFKVYNPNKVGIRLDAVLAGGLDSPFRVNLDGQGGRQFTDLEIAAQDSMFCFVSVKIPDSGSPELFHALDSIRFVLESGVVQCLRLSAYGQNVERIKGKRIERDTTLTARLPYMIYDSLSVAEGATLTLQPGTRLFFHFGAVLDIHGKLIANGTADSMIVMRVDRLDDMIPELPYDQLTGQWEGIVLRSGSFGNVLEYCDIHGGFFGIRAERSGYDDIKFRMESSIIHNVKGSCIEATGCRIEVANSQITNPGSSCVDIAGGKSDFDFCTIAAFSYWHLADQAVLLSDKRDGKSVAFAGASFRNCIITGRHESEFTLDVEDSVRSSLPYSISNSLLMVKDTSDVRFVNVVFENENNKTYGATNFKNKTVVGYRSCFDLDSLSLARGIADEQSQMWPIDLNGMPRPAVGADAGCYQYKP